MVWTEPKPKIKSSSGGRKVAVVYYLCREDGQLEHPHFMEMQVPLDDMRGRLRLRDFTERLDMLRGEGMATIFSWACKRSYRNSGGFAFVWQDLTEEDIIHPAHGNNEYILKGSHRFTIRPGHGRRSSFDLVEYKQQQQKQVTLGTDDISPPPSSSSPGDSLQETLITSGGRMRASSMLMQLISCGSITAVKSHSRRARAAEDNKEKATNNSNSKASSPPTEEGGRGRDYFSGSLVESNHRKKNTAVIKRSSSCNADRRLDAGCGWTPGAERVLG